MSRHVFLPPVQVKRDNVDRPIQWRGEAVLSVRIKTTDSINSLLPPVLSSLAIEWLFKCT